MVLFYFVEINAKRLGRAIQVPDTPYPTNNIIQHRISDSEILKGLSADTDKERTLLRKTSKTFNSLSNKLKSILRNA